MGSADGRGRESKSAFLHRMMVHGYMFLKLLFLDDYERTGKIRNIDKQLVVNAIKAVCLPPATKRGKPQ